MANYGKNLKRRQGAMPLHFAMVFFVVAVLLCLSAISGLQYSYSFVDGDEVISLKTYEDDPIRAMAEAGITLGYGDTYTLAESAGMRTVRIQRSIRVTLIVDGKTYLVSTAGQCVRDVLGQVGVEFDDDDILSCETGTLLEDGMVVELTRVSTSYSSYQVLQGSHVVYVENPAEPDGSVNVIIPGQSGIDCVVYKDTYVGGVLTSRVKCCRYTVVDTVDRVVELGTGTAARPYITLADGSVRSLPELEPDAAEDPAVAADNGADWSAEGDEGDPNAR